MVSCLRMGLLSFVVLVMGFSSRAYGAISHDTTKKIDRINKKGPYFGIVVPNSFEMDPLLQSPSFVADEKFPYLDFSGKYGFQFSLYCLVNEICYLLYKFISQFLLDGVEPFSLGYFFPFTYQSSLQTIFLSSLF